MTLNSLEEVFYCAKIWPAATNGKVCVRNFLCGWSELGFIIFTFQTIVPASPRAEDLFSTPALLRGTWCRFARMRLFVTFQANPESNWNFVLSGRRTERRVRKSDFDPFIKFLNRISVECGSCQTKQCRDERISEVSFP